MEQRDWSEVRGNKFAVKVSLDMLSKDGWNRRTNAFLAGESYSEGLPNDRLVNYDYTYVLAKLEHEFLKPLKCLTLSDLQKLLDKSKKLNQGNA
jgi:hypothetical protein